MAYLPPYSPDLNPIEESFAELKAWLKKHFSLVEVMPFEELLHTAIEVVGSRAGNHFRSCYIDM